MCEICDWYGQNMRGLPAIIERGMRMLRDRDPDDQGLKQGRGRGLGFRLVCRLCRHVSTNLIHDVRA